MQSLRISKWKFVVLLERLEVLNDFFYLKEEKKVFLLARLWTRLWLKSVYEIIEKFVYKEENRLEVKI